MGKRTNTLREYHLLVIRNLEGFSWEIRYGRNAKPCRVSQTVYSSQDEATRFGRLVLDAVREEVKASAAAD